LSAESTASLPLLAKNTLPMPAGAKAATRSASSKALGWPIWKGGAKSISAAWAWMAAVMRGRL
jgi:tetrahydromethanopterin S-methyltransferase subunit H